MSILPQPIPNERKTKAKRQVKSMGKVAAQKKRDDNRASAQQLAGQLAKFLRKKTATDTTTIDGAIDSVRLLFHRIQLIKVQHLTVVAQTRQRGKSKK